MELSDLLESPPALHRAADGTPVPLEISEEVLRVLDQEVRPGSATLETGAGLSTLLFALKGAHHTCVVPWAAEIERIREWCAGNGLSTDQMEFVQERSEAALPRLEPTPLDLVLIDGAHGFPSPFIDWYYAARRLRRDGVLVVDDTQLWTGRVLESFLEEEPGWRLERRFPLRSAVFRRTTEPDELTDWVHQPYVVQRSWNRGPRGLARKAVRAAQLTRSHGARAALRRARSG